MRTVLIITALVGSATAAASPPLPAHVAVPPAPEPASYRAQTLAADGIGLALLIAGGLSEGENGRDTSTSTALFAAGAITISLGAPIVHVANGKPARAVTGLTMRWAFAGVGILLAVAARSGCGDEEQGVERITCHADYAGYGLLGGFIVASLADAAYMTDKRVKPPAWTPRVTASRDGVGVGASWRW